MNEQKELIKASFSKASETYDTYADIQKGSAENLKGRLDNINPASILEIGCATGHYTLSLADKFPDASITSVDFSDSMIETAGSKFEETPNVRFICSDAEAMLSEMNEKFGLITSNATLQWFSDLRTSLSSIKRLLAEDGIFMASIFGPQTFNELSKALEHLYGMPVSLPTDNFAGKDDLLSILNDTFADVEMEEVNHTRRYASTFQLLRHIKKTGTTGGGSRPPLNLNRSKLRIMDDWFQQNYGECTATYQLFFIKAR